MPYPSGVDQILIAWAMKVILCEAVVEKDTAVRSPALETPRPAGGGDAPSLLGVEATTQGTPLGNGRGTLKIGRGRRLTEWQDIREFDPCATSAKPDDVPETAPPVGSAGRSYDVRS